MGMWLRPANLVALSDDGGRQLGLDGSKPEVAHTSCESSRKISKKRSVIDFVIRNRIHLWPGAVLLIWALPPWYGSTPAWIALPSVLLVGFGLYQLNRVFDLVEDQVNDPDAHARTAAGRNMIRNVAISALLASLVLSIVLLSFAATALLAVILLPGVLYSIPFLHREPGDLHRLKQVPGLKNAIPSVVWPVTTILYPAVSRPGVHELPLAVAVTAVACSIFTIEVSWDIRDSFGDRFAGIRTLATRFGLDRALVVPFVFSCAEALVIVLLIFADELSARWLLPAILLVLLPAVAYLWRTSLASNRDRSHLLVLMNISALIPLGVVGRWMV